MEQPPAPPPPPTELAETRPAVPAKNQQLTPIGWAGVIAMMALTFYFMFTYSGPFKWLAELQMRWMGSYSEKLTFVITMLVLLAPLAGAWKVVQMGVKSLGPGSAPAAAAASAAVDGPVVARPKVEGGFGGFLVFLGVIVLGIGAFMYWRGATAGELVKTSARELEEGKKPASSYLSVEGLALWKQTISFKKTTTDHYVPVISQNWKPGEVAVYLECGDSDIPNGLDAPVTTYTGLTAMGGLPGPVRVEFEKTPLRPKDGYVVLVLRDDPMRMKRHARWPLIAGAVILVVGVGWWAVQRAVMKR